MRERQGSSGQKPRIHLHHSFHGIRDLFSSMIPAAASTIICDGPLGACVIQDHYPGRWSRDLHEPCEFSDIRAGSLLQLQFGMSKNRKFSSINHFVLVMDLVISNILPHFVLLPRYVIHFFLFFFFWHDYMYNTSTRHITSEYNISW